MPIFAFINHGNFNKVNYTHAKHKSTIAIILITNFLTKIFISQTWVFSSTKTKERALKMRLEFIYIVAM